MQVSNTSVFAFVEGWSDRFFYHRICDPVRKETSLTFAVRTAEEIPSNERGKTALLSFFSYLRRRRWLLQDFKGKKFAIIFFIDKDVDEFIGARKRSKHIIYTEHYQFENYAFQHTDLCEVAAVAASLDLESVSLRIQDQTQWRLRAAGEWKDWVCLCLIARFLDAACPSGYSRHSQINDGAYGGVVNTRFIQFENDLRLASGMATPEFQRVSEKIRHRVNRIYEAGLHDQIFKGQWYARFLAEDIHTAAAGRRYNTNGLESRVLDNAIAKLDFQQTWVNRFTPRIVSLVAPLRL
jgi:hypothetical protein